jgi:RecA-family ATPase
VSPAERITRHYGGNWHGTYGTYPGEGHGQRDRSVSVSDAPDKPEGVVLKCHAPGDDWRVEMARLRRDRFVPEFEPRTANGNDNHGPKFGKRPRKPSVTYFEFADADGVTVSRKVRTETDQGKTFTWQHPDGKGGWRSGRGCDPLPYRLPELLAAPADGVIYIAEGEAKADKLAGWGFVATSSKDLPDDLSVFRGRTVAILPDNDEPGQRIADKLQSDLKGIAERAVQVFLPGLPDKGDLIDWGGNADELRELTAKALMGEPADLLPLADLAVWANRKPTPKRHVMAGFIPEHEVTLLVGAGGVNKSTFGQQLSMNYAAARSMLGVDLQSGVALYVTAEDHFDRLHWMHDHQCRALRIDPASLGGKLHLSSVRGQLNNELATFDAENRLRPTPAFYRLKATLIATRATFLTLDNVAHMYAGNENDRAQVTAFVNLLYSLCLELGITVVLIAHPNKAGDSYSGSTAWLNAVRSQLIIEIPDASIDPDERVLKLGKANYGRPGTELRFRWHDFALVREDDLPPDTRAEMAAVSRANWENEVFLRCLAARNAHQRAVSDSPSSPTYAPRIFAKMAEAKGATVDGLERAMDRLFRLGSIKANQQLWKRPNRTWVSGLAAAQDPAQDPAHDGCTEPHTTPSQVSDFPCTGVHAPHRPYTTYMEGAAHEAAAPFHEDDEVPDDFLCGWGTRSERGA